MTRLFTSYLFGTNKYIGINKQNRTPVNINVIHLLLYSVSRRTHKLIAINATFMKTLSHTPSVFRLTVTQSDL